MYVSCIVLLKKKNEEKTSLPKTRQNHVILPIWVAETAKSIATKIFLSGAVNDGHMHVNFSENWLRGFGMAKGRILAFSIDLLRRLYCLQHSRCFAQPESL